MRKICRIAREKAGSAAEERAVEQAQEASAQLLQRASDSEPIALRAFWSMQAEATNWSSMGHAEYTAALGLSPHALRIWRDRLEQSGNETDWRSLLHQRARAQLCSAANCARRKYRLTPEAADGRSNRRRFSDEQKRAIVHETEKPGASLAQVLPPPWHRHQHGLPLAGRLRPERSIGSAARNDSAGHGAANEVPALAVLRNLVRPPDGMTAIELGDGWRFFAPADSSPAAMKRQLAKREKAS